MNNILFLFQRVHEVKVVFFLSNYLGVYKKSVWTLFYRIGTIQHRKPLEWAFRILFAYHESYFQAATAQKALPDKFVTVFIKIVEIF